MPKFPERQADIKALAYTLALGAWNHSDDFPNIDVFEIIGAINPYVSARDAQNQARAAARLATEAKNVSLKMLVESMKKCLKKSEVDVTGDPEKLAQIGWGPKAVAQMTEAPTMPMNLRAKLQGKGTILLLWENPSSGGAVRNYIIQRRQQLAAGDDLNVWSIAGSAIKTEINLTGQPRGVQLEYRIKAANTGGESTPSNTIMLVL